MKRIKYYMNVYKAILKRSLMKNFAYRSEVVVKFVRAIAVVLIQVVIIRSIFGKSSYIRGWSIDDYYLLLGFYNIVNYLGWGIFNINLWRLAEKIRKGEYDFLLLLPTGSVFSSSFIDFFFDDAISALSGFLLLGYYVVGNFSEISLLAAFGSFIVIICALVISFSMNLVVASFNFLSVKNGLLELLKSLSRAGSYPLDIFSEKWRFIMIYIFPVAFFASIPARVLTGVYSWGFVFLSAFLSIIFMFFAVFIWKRMLRRYRSFGG